MIFFGKFRQITETEHTIQFVCDDKKTLAKVDYCGMLCGGTLVRRARKEYYILTSSHFVRKGPDLAKYVRCKIYALSGKKLSLFY